MNCEVEPFYFHLAGEKTETQGGKELAQSVATDKRQCRHSNSGLLCSVIVLQFSGSDEGGSPILLFAPKSPGLKDLRVMVGARAGVSGQN